MTALFIPSHSGHDQRAGILGNLVEVNAGTVGEILTGDSLEAIREAHGVTRSPAGRAADVAAVIAARSFPALTPRQLRLWLVNAGLSPEAVDAEIDTIPDDATRTKARIEWQYATSYHRNHPLVVQLGAALGLSAGEIDAAFTAAASL